MQVGDIRECARQQRPREHDSGLRDDGSERNAERCHQPRTQRLGVRERPGHVEHERHHAVCRAGSCPCRVVRHAEWESGSIKQRYRTGR